MSDIHIVFQVLNFLRDNSQRYQLIANDKLILIFLAAHDGKYGICPSQEFLSEELNISIRYLRTRLKYLESIGLISIKKEGRRHDYRLLFLSTIEDPQIPYEETIADPQILSQRIYRSGHSGSTDPTNNRGNNRGNNGGGARTTRACPLPINFWPDKQSIELGMGLGFEKTIIQEFKDYCFDKSLTSNDWQARFRKFCRDEAKYQDRKATKQKIPNDEPRSTVPEYKAPETFQRRGDPEVAGKVLGDIMSKLKSNGKGGHANELGRKGEGKTKVN